MSANESVRKAAAAWYAARRTGDPAKGLRAELWLVSTIAHNNGTDTRPIDGRLVDQVLGKAQRGGQR